MAMFVWPEGEVTGSVNVAELERIQKALKGLGKRQLADLSWPIESADQLANVGVEVEPAPEPEPTPVSTPDPVVDSEPFTVEGIFAAEGNPPPAKKAPAKKAAAKKASK